MSEETWKATRYYFQRPENQSDVGERLCLGFTELYACGDDINSDIDYRKQMRKEEI